MYLIVLLGNSSKKKGKCEIPEEDEMMKKLMTKLMQKYIKMTKKMMK